MSYDLIIVIPAHNEAQRLPVVLLDYVSVFKKTVINFKIIVVDNASVDNTANIIKDLNQGEVEVVSESRKGKGRAVKTGFERAISLGADYVGFVDADGSTSAKEYVRLFNLAKNFDGVIASRLLPGSQVYGRNIWRQLISRIFRIIRGVIVPLPFVDTQCGAKILKTEVLQKVITDLNVNDMAFDVQLLSSLYKNRFFIREESSIWVHTGNSATTSSLRPLLMTGLKMLRSLWNIRKGL